MSKRCPDCRYVNEDSRIFCASCGAALDPHLRLIQDLEKQRPKEEPRPRERGDVKFYVSHKKAPEKKKSAAPWVFLILLVAAAAIAWYFLS